MTTENLNPYSRSQTKKILDSFDRREGIHTRRCEHMQALRRRVEYLQKKIAANPRPGALGFELAEKAALVWAIEQLKPSTPAKELTYE